VTRVEVIKREDLGIGELSKEGFGIGAGLVRRVNAFTDLYALRKGSIT
jgi:hypothetical protein